MKKIMWAVLVLGLVAAGASGCVKEKLPAQQEAATTVQAPAQEMASAIAAKTDLAAVSLQEAVASVKESSTVAGVTTAAQSSTQALIREGTAVAGGVTSAAQSSAQVVARQEGALAARSEAVGNPGTEPPENSGDKTLH